MKASGCSRDQAACLGEAHTLPHPGACPGWAGDPCVGYPAGDHSHSRPRAPGWTSLGTKCGGHGLLGLLVDIGTLLVGVLVTIATWLIL